MAIQWLFCCHVSHNSMANNQNFPHTISILAMATPLPIHCSNCCIKQLDCNVSSHIKGACNACHVNGLECLSPYLLISCKDRSPPLLVHSSVIASNAFLVYYQRTLHRLDLIQILVRNKKKLESYCMFIPNPTYSRFDSNSCETHIYTHRKRTQKRASKKPLQCVVIFWPHHTSHISLFGWQGQGQG
jgi:hypothetical protein